MNPSVSYEAHQDATAERERELKLEVIELRSLCRELQGRLDRALQDDESTRMRLRDSRQRAAVREEDLCAEVERLRRSVELERRRSQIPGDWSEFNRRQNLQSSTQTSPLRASAGDRVDALVDAPATSSMTHHLSSSYATATSPTKNRGGGGSAAAAPSSSFVDEVAALAFDAQAGPILQDALQAVVLRELLRRESSAATDDDGAFLD
jgi:hypothetical protein